MPPQNPLRDEGQPQEQTGPEQVTNIRTQRVIQMGPPGADPVNIPISSHESTPNADGTFDDVITTNFALDPDGVPLDPDRFVGLSHTGRFIHQGDRQGTCGSWLHWLLFNQASAVIKEGKDGFIEGDRATCFRCAAARTRIWIAIALLGLFALAGIYKGVFGGM